MEIKKMGQKKWYSFTYQKILFVLLIGLIVLFAFMEDFIMFKPRVLFGLTENITEIGLMALPMTLIIITSGIDLSVGTIMALSAVIIGAVYQGTQNIWVAIASGLAVGTICGALNGLIISKTKVAPLVTTLATMSLYLGIAKIICGTNIYSDFPDGFTFLQAKRLFNVVPYQFLLLVVLFIGYTVFFNRSTLGCIVRGIGFNEETVKYSGIKIGKVKFLLYLTSGFIAALAGVVYLSHLPAAKPDIGANLNLQVITAVVLGGTSIMGGVGSMTGTFLGVLILGVLRKGLQIIGLGGDVYSFILGIMLIICLIGFSLVEKRQKKRG